MGTFEWTKPSTLESWFLSGAVFQRAEKGFELNIKKPLSIVPSGFFELVNVL